MIVSEQKIDRLNKHLVNQIAKKQLLKAGVKPDPTILYLPQLMMRGLEQEVSLSGGPETDLILKATSLVECLMYGPELDPEDVMRALVYEGPDPGNPESRWIEAKVLAKLNQLGVAHYAVNQALALRMSMSMEPPLLED